ncbi:hypothetical protein [Halobaculum magnesiiphilum]|uniref:DUF7964 domain-containing protein n=1 Tax=Halobaculum magnesiiphilum TaxID=1017351 RepID=A0A8T8WBG4_9EURY|nr:hypothetical protein [Halobaculum magnesiiphilum]QZP37094.1 hypothetical protein K6T50_12450 [Halobaculum magnesiiphilum]
MSGLVDSLPDQPLPRSTVDSLTEHPEISFVGPLYGERPQNRDSCHGMVIAINDRLVGLAWKQSGWVVIEQEAYDELANQPKGSDGIPFTLQSEMQEMQNRVAQHL